MSSLQPPRNAPGASGAALARVPESMVYVVDDDAAVRDTLQWLIESVQLPVATFARASDFLAAYDSNRPGCLVLDVRMAEMSGLDLQDELRTRGIALPVIILTAYAEVPMAVRALKAGAFDFLQKPFSQEVLLDRIRQALEAARGAWQARAERSNAAGRLARLTDREWQVAEYLVAGKASKVIAADLGVSPKTVDVHRSHIMEKLGVDSVARLVQLVLVAGEDTTRPSGRPAQPAGPSVRAKRSPATRQQRRR